jgi:flagellin
MEYENLITEIERIAQNTQWNGKTILTGDANDTDDDTVAFQVGANGGQTITVDFGDISQSGATTFQEFELSAHTGTESHISGSTTANAQDHISGVLIYVDSAITAVNSQRATYGAAINQLTYAVDNLSNVKVNSEAARSRIADTDYAKETSELARTQIIQQAGTAMLAQANQLPQTVLSLLQ